MADSLAQSRWNMGAARQPPCPLFSRYRASTEVKLIFRESTRSLTDPGWGRRNPNRSIWETRLAPRERGLPRLSFSPRGPNAPGEQYFLPAPRMLFPAIWASGTSEPPEAKRASGDFPIKMGGVAGGRLARNVPMTVCCHPAMCLASENQDFQYGDEQARGGRPHSTCPGT